MALSDDQRDAFARGEGVAASVSSAPSHFSGGGSYRQHPGRQSTRGRNGRGSDSRINYHNQSINPRRGLDAESRLSDIRNDSAFQVRERAFGGDGHSMRSPGYNPGGHRDFRRWENTGENQSGGYSDPRNRRRGTSGFNQRNPQLADSRNEHIRGEGPWRTSQTNLEESNLSEEGRGLFESRPEGSRASINCETGDHSERTRPVSSEMEGNYTGEFFRARYEAESLSSSVSYDRAAGAQRSHEIRQKNNGQGRKGRDLKGDRMNVERQNMNNERRNWSSQANNGPDHVLKLKHEKPSIPQLVQELEDKLMRGKVECMICCEIVGRSAATWSCASCYAMFHLSCSRKWAQAPLSIDLAVSASRSACEGNWRCPGCQSVQSVSARELRYQCFCGKLEEPSVDYYLTPHSCGEPCQKPLDKSKFGKCKHVCTLQCHPGPCPPCAALAPPQSCSCGKASFTRRCTEQEKGSICCGQPCGRRLQCGRHCCSRICHEDDCDTCEVMLTAKCFCGKMLENLPCGQLDAQGKLDSNKGVYSCGGTCGSKLSCENHSCTEKCHPGPCGECELSPFKVQTCSCGKRPLKDLSGNGTARKSCLDPVPTCGQICGKLLACKKHYCQDICHTGPCPSCTVSVEQKCRCGSTSRTVPCHVALSSEQGAAALSELLQDNEGLFLCDRKCGKKKNCGRHRCNNRCCFMFSSDGQERGSESGAVDEHLCLLTCGKKLRCGKHNCQDLCHTGHCPPCLESTFTELSCACGRSSIPPPVACGTPLPSCEYPCSIPQPCGHPATHSCHFGDCPPCTVPTAKECVGNHVTVRNVPCGSREIKCNKLCGKARQCGLHACARTCHLPPCDILVEDTRSNTCSGKYRPSCGQPCGAPRRDCSHTCASPCHPSLVCPEAWCTALVSITCSCGRLSAEVPCAAGGLIDAEIEAKIMARLPGPVQPLEMREKIPLGQRKLVCDDECAKAEKKRTLADAFNANGSGESLSTLEGGLAGSEILEMVRKDPQFVAAVEDRFRCLLVGPKRSSGPGMLRLHVFCGLPNEKRELIRQLADRWSLSVNAVGRDPRRSVIIHATSKSKVPSKGIVSKGIYSGQAIPSFNPAIDMEPGLVVGLFDLPRDADVSTLVLRFGGECELVWLNDRNALAIFGDAARASTALRRVDHASAYYGAVAMSSTGFAIRNGWGIGANSSTSKSKKSVQESSWVEDAWGEDEKTAKEHSAGVWQSKSVSIVPSKNPYGALKHAQFTVESSQRSSSVVTQLAVSSSRASAEVQGQPLVSKKTIPESAEDEDWEKAFD
ncbi:hypothetical protein O6H91_15G044900 [Diphasiastrum complanatum]|uniref:Uncharacterized protein n=3 Tax=Diphasiastrum complanatum TaxID=34168 RepID=A0ACC2BHZ8_DIPCM|nr:hypothetical protein O6H91_15G044900 [Diphasiastrum complanatum]KAJ7529326.1 hypothetical protein O6H91_15G044900 [Diphasiastrum complanatum]KAJ7529327.1 hypothetical protein O6H91_15G044900 [Diphasiastrum complanatum]